MNNSAFATFLVRNNSYLPGALLLGYALKKQKIKQELIVFISRDITASAREILKSQFTRLITIDNILIPCKNKQNRQHIPFVFNRLHALRLGPDGDLGGDYGKIVVMDADLLPLRNFESLLELAAPAGIINEKKENFVSLDKHKGYLVSAKSIETKKWVWHEIYDGICPHGSRIPKEITARVLSDYNNMGVHTCLQIMAPDFNEYKAIMQEISEPAMQDLIANKFQWPDMQYLSARWSGKWTNIDIRYGSLNGYPGLDILYGTHYGGIKPWQLKKKPLLISKLKFQDFQFWYRLYKEMYEKNMRLFEKENKLRAIYNFCREVL